MRALMVIAFALTTAATTLAWSDDVKAVVNSYLEVHAALATDKLNAVKAPAGALAARADQMGESGAAIAKAARAVEQAKDIQTARDAFAPLSDAVIAAAKAAKLPDVKIAYCSMVKASWLQKESTIRNPYYGSAMSTCGEFKK